eukprot:10969212-Prorocentrum_lima.AAC.1
MNRTPNEFLDEFNSRLTLACPHVSQDGALPGNGPDVVVHVDVRVYETGVHQLEVQELVVLAELRDLRQSWLSVPPRLLWKW